MQHNVFYPTSGQPSDSAPVIGLAQLQAQQQQQQHLQQEREPATSFHQMVPPHQQMYPEEQVRGEKPGVLHKRRGFNEAYDNDGGHGGSSGAARRVMAMFNWKRRTRAGPSVA
jgi:hypothetical protein